ncbi:T-cell immunomodulatory protein [Platysternon megacephalum]|uniref:T-cell immunomodulatory protein n=1 Tax=Platysternon megacephalum TaxID=55544 RepID=A0A4D9EL23_9SAUR|nr:T-cell immunomodulatory protein [Platysternon megacephalum]
MCILGNGVDSYIIPYGSGWNIYSLPAFLTTGDTISGLCSAYFTLARTFFDTTVLIFVFNLAQNMCLFVCVSFLSGETFPVNRLTGSPALPALRGGAGNSGNGWRQVAELKRVTTRCRAEQSAAPRLSVLGGEIGAEQ